MIRHSRIAQWGTFVQRALPTPHLARLAGTARLQVSLQNALLAPQAACAISGQYTLKAVLVGLHALGIRLQLLHSRAHLAALVSFTRLVL